MDWHVKAFGEREVANFSSGVEKDASRSKKYPGFSPRSRSITFCVKTVLKTTLYGTVFT
jgi:hypothetical protein